MHGGTHGAPRCQLACRAATCVCRHTHTDGGTCATARDQLGWGQEQDTAPGGHPDGDEGRHRGDPSPAPCVGEVVCWGQGVPLAPAPAATPTCGTPSLLLGLHMGLGQTLAKWAGGGGGVYISKPLAGANAASPPPGCRPPAPPDPGTATLARTVLSPSPGLVGTAPSPPLQLAPMEPWGRGVGTHWRGSGFLLGLIQGSRPCWLGKRGWGGAGGEASWGGGSWETRPAVGQSHCVGPCARCP